MGWEVGAGVVGSGSMRMRRVLVYGGVMLGTVAAGLAIRYAQLGLPWVVMKYGGSGMWAVMIYWVLAAGRPGGRPVRLAVATGVLATLIELTRLWRFGPLDGFRGTAAGELLLGRYFSVWNIVAYWVAIGVGAAVDRMVVRRLAGGSRLGWRLQ